MVRTAKTPPIVVIYGDDDHAKYETLARTLDAALPPEVDRALCLTTYDGRENAEQGGPTVAGVMDDLRTLPFLADRRIVVIRNADPFVSAAREPLERYAAAPATTGVLILECRSFLKTTRLAKAITACGGAMHEHKKRKDWELAKYVAEVAARQGKQFEPGAAEQLAELVGNESGILAGEVEKLCTYVGDAATVTAAHISELVGQTREEKIFAAADAAALGRLGEALAIWQQTLATDRAAPYKAVGGLAASLRRYLAAQELRATHADAKAVLGKLMMWGRPREADLLLRNQTPRRLRQALAALADLDAQVKVGARSIERGVEVFLTRLAAAAAR